MKTFRCLSTKQCFSFFFPFIEIGYKSHISFIIFEILVMNRYSTELKRADCRAHISVQLPMNWVTMGTELGDNRIWVLQWHISAVPLSLWADGSRWALNMHFRAIATTFLSGLWFSNSWKETEVSHMRSFEENLTPWWTDTKTHKRSTEAHPRDFSFLLGLIGRVPQ